MITLIADSGSTKTDWCILEAGRPPRHLLSKGLNPYFQSREEIEKEICSLLPHLNGTAIESVYFYGAGCTPEKQPVVQAAIAACLPVSRNIEVHSDMLGAARGLCGRRPGIVCILGTGSNSCFYNGEDITANVPPLGFILGDEGSGAVLGKLLVGDVLKNQLPEELREKFLSRFNLTQASIIENVYRQPFPNRFLASLSPFLAENLDQPEIRALVSGSFKAFFQRNVRQYDCSHPVHFIGSIAHHYREVLQETAQELDIRTGTIVQSPIDGLIQYHTHNHH